MRAGEHPDKRSHDHEGGRDVGSIQSGPDLLVLMNDYEGYGIRTYKTRLRIQKTVTKPWGR